MDANRLELGAKDVEVEGVSVRYGDVAALEGVSFSVERGRVLAIVGANGAGKSTLFRALLGLVPLQAGVARVLGRTPAQLDPRRRSRLAYVSERHAELAHQTLSQLARFRASLYPRFDAALLSDLSRDLELPREVPVGQLSRGQRAAVVVSLALAQRPDLVLLDDPTLGLDPLARRRIIQAALGASRDREVTVVLATHELADVERVADDLVLLRRGRADPVTTLDAFIADACSVEVPLATGLEAIHSVEGVLHVWQRRRNLQVVIRGDELARARSLRALSKLAATTLTPAPISFEEVALAYLARKDAA